MSTAVANTMAPGHQQPARTALVGCATRSAPLRQRGRLSFSFPSPPTRFHGHPPKQSTALLASTYCTPGRNWSPSSQVCESSNMSSPTRALAKTCVGARIPMGELGGKVKPCWPRRGDSKPTASAARKPTAAIRTCTTHTCPGRSPACPAAG